MANRNRKFAISVKVAEKEGFEPPVALPRQLISSQSHSATLPLLLKNEPEKRFSIQLASSDWLQLTLNISDQLLGDRDPSVNNISGIPIVLMKDHLALVVKPHTRHAD